MILARLSLPPEISKVFDKFVNVLLSVEGELQRETIAVMNDAPETGHLIIMIRKLLGVLRGRGAVRRERATQVLAGLCQHSLYLVANDVDESRATKYRVALIDVLARIGMSAGLDGFHTLFDLSRNERDMTVRFAACQGLRRWREVADSQRAAENEPRPVPVREAGS